jgi:hypothetical protein
MSPLLLLSGLLSLVTPLVSYLTALFGESTVISAASTPIFTESTFSPKQKQDIRKRKSEILTYYNAKDFLYRDYRRRG